MGFRFRKSFKAGPFRLNISKNGVGWSAGVPGFRYTKKAGGGSRTTYSLPGTGLSYVKDSKKRKVKTGGAANSGSGTKKSTPRPEPKYAPLPERNGMGFFERSIAVHNLGIGEKVCMGLAVVTLPILIVFCAAAFGGSGDTGEQPPHEPAAVVVQATPEPTAEPTPEPTPEETPAPEIVEVPKEAYDDSWEYADEPMVVDGEQAPAESGAEQQAAQEYTEPAQEAQPQGDMVWIAGSGNGTKYHSDPSCSNMSNPVQISLADAQARGYEACKRCY